MKTMTKTQKNILAFAAGTGGRFARGIAGASIAALGVIAGGWWLLLLVPGAFMIGTGVMNYCPAGLVMTGSGRSEDILANIAKLDALGSKVGKH
jgi:hypothetical protein